MALAIALMSHRSLGFALYAASLDGRPAEALAAEYGISIHEVRERIAAAFLTFTKQVWLGINPNASAFGGRTLPTVTAA
jgi:hypothetical protein